MVLKIFIIGILRHFIQLRDSNNSHQYVIVIDSNRVWTLNIQLSNKKHIIIKFVQNQFTLKAISVNSGSYTELSYLHGIPL